MKDISLTKIAIWLTLAINILMWLEFIPSFLNDYTLYQENVWKMDSTQNQLIKELIDSNNKLVDNQSAIMNYLKEQKEE